MNKNTKNELISVLVVDVELLVEVDVELDVCPCLP